MAASLEIRKRADRSSGRRIKMADPDGTTGHTHKLVNPDTPGQDHEPWPLAGVDVIGDPPDECGLSTHFVARGIAEGWIEGEGEEVVHRPGGPASNKWAVTHTFLHYDALLFDFASGVVRYKVVRQPDKYVADGTDKQKVTDEIYADGETQVDTFYWVKLQKGKG
jgi:hypothetical protein